MNDMTSITLRFSFITIFHSKRLDRNKVTENNLILIKIYKYFI